MIDGLTNGDALPVLERMMRFAGARQRLLAHNIANLDTPDFRPVDVSVGDFRAALAEAVDERRERFGLRGGELGEIRTDDAVVADGTTVLSPRPIHENVLFHDGNDRDPERLVQAMVENFEVFRVTADLIRSRYDLMYSAIRGQV